MRWSPEPGPSTPSGRVDRLAAVRPPIRAPTSLGSPCLPARAFSFGLVATTGDMASTALDQAEYISLRSYRRDGTAVDTPSGVLRSIASS